MTPPSRPGGPSTGHGAVVSPSTGRADAGEGTNRWRSADQAAADKVLLVQGARQHNLKNITVRIPREKLVVITGVSGSGKSSLAFDTIYAEGQRRYVESLSAYARQFLDQLDKPDVDSIDGLSPAIAIEQRSLGRNPRSTVGTTTEIHDHLRLLFARIGHAFCWGCGREIASQTVGQMVELILALPEGSRVSLLAPLIVDRKGHHARELEQLQRQGFHRVRVDGAIQTLQEPIELDKNRRHTIEVVVDRIQVRRDQAARLADSLETCLKLGEGTVLAEPEGAAPLILSERFACPDCGISFPEIQPRSFSFNSPHGACPACHGLGQTSEIDADLVVPDPTLSVREGALVPWSSSSSEYFGQMVEVVLREMGGDPDVPWEALPSEVRQVLLFGSGTRQFRFDLESKKGRGHHFTRPFEGVVETLRRLYHQTDSDNAREYYDRYLRRAPCTQCGGQRLRRESLHVRVGGKNIAEVSAMSVGGVLEYLDHLDLTPTEVEISSRLLRELRARLHFLVHVGLEYLTLDRATATLAGGEAQRIRLATQLGAALVGVLYVLDEPSVGLHPRDNGRLLETLERLKALGNTVLVVEHDEETIRRADQVIDLGPGAGRFGGEMVAQGTAAELERCDRSLTGLYLSGKRRIEMPTRRRPPNKGWLVVRGARQHNLKAVDVAFPLGCLVVVTGVSGSGKSSLVLDTLYPALARRLHRSSLEVGRFDRLEGVEQIDKVINIDQSPIGRTPRSNPATYTGAFNPIRELFSRVPEARLRGYGPGRFSFNVKGGRCEACKGDGTVRIEMHFLPDVYVTCDQCHGQRFNRETLEVKIRGASIADVLAMTVREAEEFFHAVPAIHEKLAMLEEVGLGYLALGQPAPTLSGGEAQRIKISRELARRDTGRTLYLLDEPTTGLHFEDIRKLLQVLCRLVDAGNTVIVIEHNLEVIKTADWVLDLGPEGGDGGGDLVVCGPPEAICRAERSYTGRFLKPILERG
ncbi:MAG: excinuclease ABC subunit UvrA [Bradymonadales bacterium]|nr:excinuclease ABC subunit UvrA [Bradymonadales bacterium]